MAQHIEFEQWVAFPIEQVFAFFADPRNLPRIMPAKSGVKLGELKLVAPPPPPNGVQVAGSEHFAGVGSEIPTYVKLVPFLPLRVLWIAFIKEFEWNHHFADVQVKGPFQKFHHRHELKTEARDGVQGTFVKDVIDLEFGLGPIGDVLFQLFVKPQMQQTFSYRQKVLPELLAGASQRIGSTNTAVP